MKANHSVIPASEPLKPRSTAGLGTVQPLNPRHVKRYPHGVNGGLMISYQRVYRGLLRWGMSYFSTFSSEARGRKEVKIRPHIEPLSSDLLNLLDDASGDDPAFTEDALSTNLLNRLVPPSFVSS